MTTTLLNQPRSRLAERRGRASAGGGLTLAERLQGTWQVLGAAGVAVCPVCRGRMSAEHGSERSRIHGACGRCGATLS